TEQNNHIRYQKQVKCLADVHEAELELLSLLVAAYDPALREGVFKESALDSIEELDADAQVEFLIGELWEEENGSSDLAAIWQKYRNKVAAFLVLPFGDGEIYSNAWSCTLKDSSWEALEESDISN